MKITQIRLVFCLLAVIFMSSCVSTKKISVRHQKINKVVSTAQTFIGTPYRYGGTTRKGMDCSALLMNSYQIIDVALPRTAKAQSDFGKKVSINNLEPGDLVFFARKKGRRKVTHAGMVTAVKKNDEIRFIHASSSRGVIESNLLSKYYRGVFVKARRPVN